MPHALGSETHRAPGALFRAREHAGADRRAARAASTATARRWSARRVYFYGERMVCELCRPLRREAPAREEVVHSAEHERTVKRRFARLNATILRGRWTPSPRTSLIDRPREEVFDYLADIANHPEFSDHYLKDWRLTRVDSVGRGAGARFKLDAPLDRFAWGDMTFIEVERAAPDRRRRPRRQVQPQQDVDDLDARAVRAAAPRVEVTTESEPALPTDKFMEAVTRRRGWTKRNLRKALQPLQSILEEDIDRGARATVGGL